MFESVWAEACHRNALVVFIASIISLTLTPFTHAQNGSGSGTRLLRTATVSATQIAFAYANNIWVVPRTGGSARRLTSF